jgi:hypothetical protein
MAEHLPSKYDALSSNSRLTKKKKKKSFHRRSESFFSPLRGRGTRNFHCTFPIVHQMHLHIIK